MTFPILIVTGLLAVHPYEMLKIQTRMDASPERSTNRAIPGLAPGSATRRSTTSMSTGTRC